MTIDEQKDVEALYEALITQEKEPYEALKVRLIEKYENDRFYDILSEAFVLVVQRHKFNN